MGNDKFYKNSILLTTSNITTGILGFMFSIILSRKLGAEGMALYGLVMPMYNLFICIMCGGIITAISKISAVYFDQGDFGNIRKTIKTTFIFNLIWALFIAIIIFSLAPFIANYMIKDPRTLSAIKIICPAMVFIALSNILKGYFYGTSNITFPAFIDIFEKGVRILVILSIIFLVNLSTITSMVTAAYIALCIGEFLSLVLLYIYYKKNIKKHPILYKQKEGRAQLLFNVLTISLPLCLSGFVTTALSSISTLIVPRRLVAAGLEYSNSLSLIGKFSGMSLSIVFFPMVVVGSISTLLIPDLSQSINKKDYESATNRIKEVLFISFLLGICTLAICQIAPKELGLIFFKREDLYPYIKFLSLCLPIFYTSITTYSILNGIGKQNLMLRNSIICAVIEIILLYVLTAIPSINIYGVGISLMIDCFIALILNLYEIKKSLYITFSFYNLIILLLLGILSYFILSILNTILHSANLTLRSVSLIIIGFSFFPLGLFIKKDS